MISHVGKRFIQKASISKPDGIFIGGTRKDKFIGCLYNASVAIHWTGNLPITELDLVHMYARGDPNVSGKDLFVGACANRNAECVSRNKLYLTRAIGWISSPFNPKEVKRCTWVLIASRSRRVKLELHRLRVNNSNSCINNQVRVMEGQTDGRQVIGRYCNPNLQSPIVLYSNGRYLTVVLENLQSDDTVDFFAKYTMTSLSEGPCPVFKDVTSSSGIITSPDFPYIYGNSKKCTWRIRVPHGKHVLITFKRKDFKVDGCSDDCRCDYLGISTSIKHGIKSKYCGTSPPSPIYSRQSVVRMDFISDSKYSHQGFKATYTAVSSLEDQCPSYKELHTYSGTITSPRYPLPYPGEVDCFWIIKSPPNSRIDLTFSKPINLDINCTDFVEVTDSAIKRHQTFMVTLCNSTELPATFSTYNRKLIVRFVSDKYQRMTWSMKSGFKAEYKILLMAALQTGSSVVQHTILSSSWIFLFLILHTIVLN